MIPNTGREIFSKDEGRVLRRRLANSESAYATGIKPNEAARKAKRVALFIISPMQTFSTAITKKESVDNDHF